MHSDSHFHDSQPSDCITYPLAETLRCAARPLGAAASAIGLQAGESAANIYQAVFDSVPEAIALIHGAGQWIDVNPAFCELLGLPKAALLQRNLYDFFAPGTQLFTNWQGQKSEHRRGMVWLYRADGAAQQTEYDLWLNDCPQQHRLILREPVGHFLDEVLCRLPAGEYEELLGDAHAAISRQQFYADYTWQTTYFSSGCAAIFGFSAEELAMAPDIWRSRIPIEDWETQILPSFRIILAEGQGAVHYHFRHRNGDLRLISRNYTSRRDPANNCWIVTLVETCTAGASSLCATPDPAAEANPSAPASVSLVSQEDCVLSHLSRIILSSLDLDVLFDTVSIELLRLLQVDRVEVIRYLPLQQSWQIIASRGRHPQICDRSGLTIPDHDHPFGDALRRLEVVQLNKLGMEEVETAPELLDRFPGTWLLVPLHVPVEVNGVRSHQLWGSLGFNCQQRCYRWQAHEIHLVRQVAHQLAIGIQKAELHQALKQFNDQLEHEVYTRTQQLHRSLSLELLLRRITDNIRSSLDENQILQTIVEQLTQQMGISGCDVATYDYDTETLTIHSGYAADPNLTPPEQNWMPIDHDFARQYQWQSTILHCPIQMRLRSINAGYEVLSCAIADDQQILGDMWVFRRCEAGSFSSAEIRVIQQVANQCAIALRQSRLYQASQHQVRELERVNQLKDDFLSTVSHELRTPISNINMATQMLEVLLFGSQSSDALRHPEALPDQCFTLDREASQRLYRYFQILQDECRREIALINDLLDLSRLDAQSEPLFLTTLNLSDWLRHLSEPFLARVQECHCELRFRLSEPIQVSTDLKFLERLVSELLNNACKYTPAGEVITLAAYRLPGDRCQIIVSNSGVEISPNEQARVFEKFYRIPSNDPWRHEGTGLGLALVSRLAERLGGTITLTSENNLTQFVVEIPSLHEKAE